MDAQTASRIDGQGRRVLGPPTAEPDATLPTAEQTAQRIAELARLSLVDYDRARPEAALELGVRASTLDDQVGAKRKKLDQGEGDGPMFDDPAAWPHPVAGGALLSEIASNFSRFVIADAATIDAAALWAVHTYLLGVLTVSPIAHISSPEKRCGKTVLLSAMGKLAFRPLQAANISPAATFRAVEKWHPTLLIDEADSFLRDNEPLRGILNSGHMRDSAFVIRCDGDDFEPTRFSTWGAKAIAGIGRMADTLEDRAIPLRMRRKLPGEKVLSLRRAAPETFTQLRAQIIRWSGDNAQRVGRTEPAQIAGLHDRAQDNFEPLLAIAEAAGGEWPQRARDAALALCGQIADAPADE
ncbi:phiRv2 prophage protein, partial [mine drainage metagenome]